MKQEHWDQIAKSNGFDSMKDLLEAWYNVGHCSINSIARQLQVTDITVTKLLKMNGIEVRKMSAFKVARDIALNLSVEQIARKFKVPKSTAWRAKRKAIDS